MRSTRVFSGCAFAVLAMAVLTSAHTAPQDVPKAPQEVPKKWHDQLAQPIGLSTDGGAIYGSAPKLKEQVALADVEREPDRFAGRDVKLRGRITSICTKKGCWMRMVDGERELFVRFKDYGFFVPRHLAGYDVELEGPVSMKIETEAARRHYAEDAGKSPEEIAKIVGDRRELSMLASSVVIREPAPPCRIEITLGGEPGAAQVVAIGDLAAQPAKFEGKRVSTEARLAGHELGRASWLMLEDAGAPLYVELGALALTPELSALLAAQKSDVRVRVAGVLQMLDDGKTGKLIADHVFFRIGPRKVESPTTL
ncbi:MAG: DUF4920 domain-containing protein [Planctomycetota bacterium]